MMKKLLVLFLACVSLAVLAACGGAAADDEREPQQQSSVQQPADPELHGPAQPEGAAEEAARLEQERLERERLEQERKEAERLEQERQEAARLEQEKSARYEKIVDGLFGTAAYKQDGEVVARGNAAKVLWYRDLLELGDYKDCAALREQFVLLEGKFLYTEELFTKRMGETRTFSGSTLHYDAAGNVSAAYVAAEHSVAFNLFFPYGMENDLSFTYDEAGNMIERKSYSLGGDVRSVTTFAYENGVLASACLRNNMGDYDFTYVCDEQGRLKVREWDNNTGSRHNVCTFTYDEAGRVIGIHVDEQKLSTPTWPCDTWDWNFVYEGDVLVSSTFRKDTYNGFKLSNTILNETTYVCDEQGRVLSSLTTYGGSDNYIPSYATREVTFRYGDYLVCPPAQEN